MPCRWGRGAPGGSFVLGHWWLVIETTIALIDFRSGRGPRRRGLAVRRYAGDPGRILVAIVMREDVLLRVPLGKPGGIVGCWKGMVRPTNNDGRALAGASAGIQALSRTSLQARLGVARSATLRDDHDRGGMSGRGIRIHRGNS